MRFDPDDVPSNRSGNPHFADLVASRLARRTVLKGATASALLSFMATSPGAAHAAPRDRGSERQDGRAAGRRGRGLLGFAAIPLSGADQVRVPAGYDYDVILPWGDPIQPDGPAWKADASNTAAEQAQQLGMGHDGMHLFELDDDRALLVLNHEYTIDEQLFPFPGGPYEQKAEGSFAPTGWTAEHTAKSMAAHGLSVVEIERDEDGRWKQVRSRYARRVTPTTPMAVTGPAAGHRLMSTHVAGRQVLGTFNNCSSGKTPWGTYLAAEENFNGYFNVTDAAVMDAEQRELASRYGLGASWYEWWRTHDRFDADRHPNEPNKYGWMVELDPLDPDSTPVKRTALGRFKHEGAAITTGQDGRAVVYMGDDERGDYIYKFVSASNWRSMRARGISPLDEGTLYVARFDEDGRGVWLPLTIDNPELAEHFQDQGELLVKTRIAADLLGATRMDRPEWAAVDPRTGDVYCTLTNNENRGRDPEQPVNAANPREANPWGHIIRWTERRGDNTATEFTWDLFLLAGPGDGADGSTIDAEDAFGSPDGLGFDADGRLYILTDGSQPGGANDQMLIADPVTGEVRRFLTGVRGCEVTGLTFSSDQTTVFVNIQHPGDTGTPADPDAESRFPYDQGRPRAATVAVRRVDGGVIGT